MRRLVRTARRHLLNIFGQMTTLAMPVSSSNVAKITPDVALGRCRTNTGLATFINAPSVVFVNCSFATIFSAESLGLSKARGWLFIDKPRLSVIFGNVLAQFHCRQADIRFIGGAVGRSFE